MILASSTATNRHRAACGRRLATAIVLAVAIVPALHAAEPLHYRGTLQDGGKPANGVFELQLQVFDAQSGGKALSETTTLSQVTVRDGRFDAMLDLPASIESRDVAFLQAAIKAPGDAQFHPLGGRQQIKGAIGACWTVGGNELNSGVVGLNQAGPDGLFALRSGDQYVYVRGGGGFEQAGSSALGAQSTALNSSSARGEYSFTAGKGETVNTHSYSVAFADGQAGAFSTTASDQFIVRARNGVAINTPPPDLNVELTVTATPGAGDFADLWLRPDPAVTTNAAGVMLTVGGATNVGPLQLNNAAFYIDQRSEGGTNFFRRFALETDGSVSIRSSTTNANAGVTMAPGSGSWSSLSDRNLKTAIVPADVVAVLDRVVAMPLHTWSYVAQGDGVRHLGPMAQDFAAAFGLGENDTTISNVDADGVALAAIQGLNAKLERENAELRTRLHAIEAALAQRATHDAR
jgi:hypothetical protein